MSHVSIRVNALLVHSRRQADSATIRLDIVLHELGVGFDVGVGSGVKRSQTCSA